MNIRDLSYLVAVADTGSVARAAEQCHVGQPTLSIQIKKLEAYLGVTVFERVQRRLRISEAGKPIIAIARHIVAESERLRQTARSLADPFALPFRLGVFPTLAPYLLPRVMPEISRTLPQLSLRLIEEKSPVLTEQLLQGQIDAILTSLPIHHNDVEMSHLFDDPFLLACPAEHPLAKRKQLTRADLDGQTLLLLEDGHCMRDQALELCSVSHAREDDEFRATSLETLRHMVAAGTGITLIPQIAALPTLNLVYVPFRPSDRPVRPIALAWRKSSAHRMVIDDLVAIFKKI
ncbi:MAG: LysR family transcriptional regulator [Alphaproteobacteria bacterium]|nr:LysR family transcriptional regulator [Alphaproteobacteria bacterium]